MALKLGRHEGDPLYEAAVAQLERNLAADTAISETQLRPQIAAMLVADPSIAIDDLLARVFREVFLLPLDDPWNGLNPPDAFFALDGNGTRDARSGR